MNRGQLYTEAREAADAVGSQRWTPTTMARVLDGIYRDEWADILNVNPFLRAAERSPTVAADGSFALADLSVADGDNSERYYRIIGVHSGQSIYRPETLKNNLVDATMAQSPRIDYGRGLYYQIGDRVYLRPAPGEALSVWVNHLPQTPSLLVSDDSEVVFPEDREMILVYELAAHMLAKGGAETQAASALKSLAEDQREKMGSDLSRIEIDPRQFARYGSNAQWAG